MSDQLRMTREDVMTALSLLNAHGMITCTFVGSLVIFRLKETQALGQDAAPDKAEKAEKPARKKQPALA
jgi:hypothetical protein